MIEEVKERAVTVLIVAALSVPFLFLLAHPRDHEVWEFAEGDCFTRTVVDVSFPCQYDRYTQTYCKKELER